MKKPTYTKKQVAMFTGLTERQVQFYASHNLVEGYQETGGGRGHHIKYCENDIIKFLFIRELTKFGIPIKRIQNLLNFVFSKTVNEPELKKYIEGKKFLHGEQLFIHYQVVESVESVDKINVTSSIVGYKIIKNKQNCLFNADDLDENSSNVLLINLGSMYKKMYGK